MPYNIKDENGNIIISNIPDDVSPDSPEVMDAIRKVGEQRESQKQKETAQQPQEVIAETAGALLDYGKDFAEEARINTSERVAKASQYLYRAADPKDPIEATDVPVLVLGQIAGGVLDMGGQAFDLVLDGISLAIPDTIEDKAKQKFVEGAQYLFNTDTGKEAIKALDSGIETYGKWAEKNPVAHEKISNVVNIGLVVAPVGSKIRKENTVVSKEKPMLQRIGVTMENKANQQIDNAKEKKAIDLLLPPLTDSYGVEEKTGIFKRRVPTFSAQEQQVVDRLAALDIKPSDNTFAVHKKIQEQIKEEARQLELDLDLSATNQMSLTAKPISVPQLIGDLETKFDDLIENDAFLSVNGMDKNARVVQKKIAQLIEEYGDTPLGLLNARRALDEWARGYKSDKAIFSSDSVETAFKKAINVGRTHLNDAIADASPSVKVKDSLKSQSLLYQAGDVVDAKLRKEASTNLGRAWQNITNITGIKFPTTPLAIGATVTSGLGSAGVVSGIVGISLTGIITTVIAKGAMSPQTKKLLAQTLQGLDKSISVVKNGSGYAKGTLQQLRADRAAILELMQSYPVEKEQEEK